MVINVKRAFHGAMAYVVGTMAVKWNFNFSLFLTRNKLSTLEHLHENKLSLFFMSINFYSGFSIAPSSPTLSFNLAHHIWTECNSKWCDYISLSMALHFAILNIISCLQIQPIEYLNNSQTEQNSRWILLSNNSFSYACSLFTFGLALHSLVSWNAFLEQVAVSVWMTENGFIFKPLHRIPPLVFLMCL